MYRPIQKNDSASLLNMTIPLPQLRVAAVVLPVDEVASLEVPVDLTRVGPALLM
jgi:hypothetical protein